MKTWQVRYMLNGKDRVERVRAATPYDAIKHIQAKYENPDKVFAYHVVIVSTPPRRRE